MRLSSISGAEKEKPYSRSDQSPAIHCHPLLMTGFDWLRFNVFQESETPPEFDPIWIEGTLSVSGLSVPRIIPKTYLPKIISSLSRKFVQFPRESRKTSYHPSITGLECLKFHILHTIFLSFSLPPPLSLSHTLILISKFKLSKNSVINNTLSPKKNFEDCYS